MARPPDADARHWTSIEEDLQAEIDGLRAFITANVLVQAPAVPVEDAAPVQCACPPMELCDVCHGDLAERYGSAATVSAAPPADGAKTQEGRNFDVEQSARAIESMGDKTLALRLRHAWQAQLAPAAAGPAQQADTAAFSAWWSEFEQAHPDWLFADSGALRLASWTAGIAHSVERGVDIGLLRLALAQKKHTLGQADARIEQLEAEVTRLNRIINTPQSNDFLRAVSTEAEHQRQRWGSSHDAEKSPADWFWLIGYLAGKALQAHVANDAVKAEHHLITTAAALANWHRMAFGSQTKR